MEAGPCIIFLQELGKYFFTIDEESISLGNCLAAVLNRIWFQVLKVGQGISAVRGLTYHFALY